MGDPDVQVAAWPGLFHPSQGCLLPLDNFVDKNPATPFLKRGRAGVRSP